MLVLGRDALAHSRLYLDTNYWANLRDSLLGTNKSTDVSDLLTILRQAVQQGDAICTYSSHTLEELMKHASLEVREASALVMDELSGGYCLANPERLLDNEIVYWIAENIAKKDGLLPLSQLAWTRPFFLVVDYDPPRLPIDPEVDEHLRMGFIDKMWSMRLREVVSVIHARPEGFPTLEWPQQAADLINQDAPAHSHENSSLEAFFLSELEGALDWAQERIGQLYGQVAQRWQLPLIPSTQEELLSVGRVIRQGAMVLARSKRLQNGLPGIQIRSWLHAALRNDRRRRFKANDLVDFEHAQTALPHCNYFLTDGPHAQLIASVKLDVRFDCMVIGSVHQACVELGPAFSAAARCRI